MADFSDVRHARTRADTARATLDRENDPAVMATLLAALAVTAELRALGVTLDYASNS